MAWLHRDGWVEVVVVVIDLRWMDGGYAGGTATWPDFVAATLSANFATGAPSGSACVDCSDSDNQSCVDCSDL